MAETESETEILDNLHKKLRLDLWWQDIVGDQAIRMDSFDVYKAADALSRTEALASEEIARKLKNILSYTEKDAQWYLWNGKIHRPCDGDLAAVRVARLYYAAMCDALEFVQSYLEKEAQTVADSGVTDADKKSQAILDVYRKVLFPPHRAYRDKLASDAGITSLVRMMRSDLVVAKDYYEKDQQWLVLDNYVMDLNVIRDSGGNPDWAMVFQIHSPERPVTKILDIPYDPTVNYGHWDRYLSRSIPSEVQRKYLQKALGAAFMGESKLRCILNIFGPPGSGKSVMLDTMHKLGKGGAGYVAAPDSRALTKVSGQNFEQDAFRGRRIIAVSEPSSTEKIDDDFLKRFSGDEWIETRTLNVKSSGWVPQGIVLVASNKLLKINTRDKAVVDRLQMIEFPVVFKKPIEGFEDTIPENERMIDGLEDLLMLDKSRILTWLIQGMRNFVMDGRKLSPPDEVVRSSGQNVTESSTALRFITDFVDEGFFEIDPMEDPEFFIPESEVYSRYRLWVEEHGERRSLTRRFFVQDVDSRYNMGGETVRHNGTKKLFGVKPTLKYRARFGANAIGPLDGGR